MKSPTNVTPATLLAVLISTNAVWGERHDEFIYNEAPFPQCHASTIAETPTGLVAAWFGGTHEKHPDVGIWVSRKTGSTWSPPIEVANGIESEDQRYPCWNPVLFQVPTGPLLLFFKVGPDPQSWWGLLSVSQDGGRTWGPARRLPEQIFGPIKNKPIRLSNGRILCGTSTEDRGWRVHMEWTDDLGANWGRTDAINDGTAMQAIQPTILQHGDRRLQILCRSKGLGRVVTAWSDDAGETWSAFSKTELPNPNSGIDGLTLHDGRHLLVYNHTTRGRTPLNVATSADGQDWKVVAILEDTAGEYSYPAVIQSADHRLHITYTWKRQRVKHVTLDPRDF